MKEREALTKKDVKVIDAKIMVGKSKFGLPTQKKLENYLNAIRSGERHVMLGEIAAGQSKLEGRITLKELEQKVEKIKYQQEDPIQDHV